MWSDEGTLRVWVLRRGVGIMVGPKIGRFTSLIVLAVLVVPVAKSPASGAPEMPRSGGVFVKNNIYSEPRSMDPIFALGASTIMVQMNIFDGLVRAAPARNASSPAIPDPS